jgi:transcriptional regulator with XRE-family HTH domain
MIRLGAKSQAEIAELFNVDRSTISRIMKEVREKELLNAVRWLVAIARFNSGEVNATFCPRSPRAENIARMPPIFTAPAPKVSAQVISRPSL